MDELARLFRERPVELVAAIGSVAAAVGTLVLAVFTGKLGQATKDMAQATHAMARTSQENLTIANRQAELARMTMEASIQPLLVDVPRTGAPIEEQVHFPDELNAVLIRTADRIVVEQLNTLVRCSIPLRNVGAGAALITRADFYFGDATWSNPWITSVVVPPGASTRISFSIALDQLTSPLVAGSIMKLSTGPFDIEVRYRNTNGSRAILSKVTIRRDPSRGDNERFYVDQVWLFEEEGYVRGQSKAFTGTRPG